MRRLCIRCRRAPSIESGSECRECLNETLRETRSAVIPEWIRRAQEKRLDPKVFA